VRFVTLRSGRVVVVEQRGVLSLADAARVLKVERSTVTRAVQAGALRAHRWRGKRGAIVSCRELLRFAQARVA
jgi:excisionase family DNA binding protein